MLLVTGAPGNIGTPLVEMLLAKGEAVRVLAHNPQKAAELMEKGAEIVAGDFTKPETLDLAFTGVAGVFLLSSASPDIVTMQGNVIAAAKRAGVGHIVKLSALGVSPDVPVSMLRWHAEVEQQLTASGIPFTILKPNAFYQNNLGYAQSVKAQGMIALPQGDGKVSQVDVRDIAAVAAAVLTESGHAGQAYDITGPEALSTAEITAKMSAALGKAVMYQDVPPDAFTQQMQGFGVPDWLARGLTELEQLYAGGNAAQVTDVVARVGKVTPRTFDQWFAENIAAFQ